MADTPPLLSNTPDGHVIVAFCDDRPHTHVFERDGPPPKVPGTSASGDIGEYILRARGCPDGAGRLGAAVT